MSGRGGLKEEKELERVCESALYFYFTSKTANFAPFENAFFPHIHIFCNLSMTESQNPQGADQEKGDIFKG